MVEKRVELGLNVVHLINCCVAASDYVPEKFKKIFVYPKKEIISETEESDDLLVCADIVVDWVEGAIEITNVQICPSEIHGMHDDICMLLASSVVGITSMDESYKVLSIPKDIIFQSFQDMYSFDDYEEVALYLFPRDVFNQLAYLSLGTLN